MKKILMSIHPEWCEKIFNGEKTIEVRKSCPKSEPPFEVYVYETRRKFVKFIRGAHIKYGVGRGKVIGTFVCDKVEKFTVGSLRSDDIERQACLSYSELINYFYNGKEPDGETVKWGYGWHITEPKLFDNPKELTEFRGPNDYVYESHFYGREWVLKPVNLGGCPINIPPQSWRYVEAEK